MPPHTSDFLPRLDAALLSLRRLTNAPAARPDVTHGDRPIEFSTMLVVDAIARLSGPGRQHEVPVVAIANALQVTPSTASRLVERAVGSGMADRAASGVDPRRAALSLTADGCALHAEAVAFRTRRLQALLQDWSDEDLAHFTGLLERFAERVRAEPEQHPKQQLRQGDQS